MNPSLRVLIVDDTDYVRELLRTMLEFVPCQIVGCVASADEAVLEAQLQQPDLVIMDFMMPRRSGVDATREIKARCPRVEVVGFTSTGDPRDNEAMLEAGASQCFSKLHILDLIELVEERARSYPRGQTGESR